VGGGKRGSLDGRAQRGGGVARGRRTRAEGPARQCSGAARCPRVGSTCAGLQDEAGSGEIVEITPPESACGAHAAPQRGRVGAGDCGPLPRPGPRDAAAAQPRASRPTAPHSVTSTTVRPSRTRAGALYCEARFAPLGRLAHARALLPWQGAAKRCLAATSAPAARLGKDRQPHPRDAGRGAALLAPGQHPAPVLFPATCLHPRKVIHACVVVLGPWPLIVWRGRSVLSASGLTLWSSSSGLFREKSLTGGWLWPSAPPTGLPTFSSP
jgi:hypothetical protein